MRREIFILLELLIRWLGTIDGIAEPCIEESLRVVCVSLRPFILSHRQRFALQIQPPRSRVECTQRALLAARYL